MSDQDAFERILASLYDTMLNDALWPATSALIDEACGMEGSALGVIGVGLKDDMSGVTSSGLWSYYRGHRLTDRERDLLRYLPSH